MLGLMKKSGCTRLYVGFESVNEKTLQLFNKQSSPEKNEAAIRRFQEAGFSVHGMFVLGSDEDTVETVRETVNFARRSMLGTAQFFSLMALPGTPLTTRYGEKGKILSRDWRLYDAHHVVIRPARIPPHILQKELVRAHLRFYSWKEALRHLLFSKTGFTTPSSESLATPWRERSTARCGPTAASCRPWTVGLKKWKAGIRGWQDNWGSRFRTSEEGSRRRRTRSEIRGGVHRWLRKSLDKIPQEFSSYGQRYASVKTEAIFSELGHNETARDSLPPNERSNL
jgi:hypothetical protein